MSQFFITAEQFSNILKFVEIRKNKAAPNNFDFWAIDFNDELSAFSGKLLLHQTEFVNDCIRFLLSHYSESVHPTQKVVVVGHSMGGMVARALFFAENYVPHSVEVILTLSTPHWPVLLGDAHMESFYAHVNDKWRVHGGKLVSEKLENVSVVSLAGSFRDTLIDASLTDLSHLPFSHALSLTTSEIPSVWLQTDHQCILWCNQLMKVLSTLLLSIISPKTRQATLPLSQRVSSFRSILFE